LAVPAGGRAIVAGGLLLSRDESVASTAATAELTQAIDAWTGPGALVLAGDTFDLLCTPTGDVQPALTAHPRFSAAVRSFASCPERRVVVLPGTRDHRLAWDAKAAAVIRDQLGGCVALAAELQIETGAGCRLVRVEPGHQLDPVAAFSDPGSPCDSPLHQHLVKEVLPSVGAGAGSWLGGIDELDDPACFPRFLASRLAYRRLGRHLWWLLLPLLVALVLRIPVTWAISGSLHGHGPLSGWTPRVLIIGGAVLVDLLLVAVVAGVVTRRTWVALSGVSVEARDTDPNEPARAEARRLLAAGHTGLITGHTRHPELTHLGTGFYANVGSGSEVVGEVPVRFSGAGVPPVFLAHRQLGWVELEAGAALHARLLYGRTDLPGATIWERILAQPRPQADLRPAVVSSYPQGASWPPTSDPARRTRRIRRWGAFLLTLAAVLNLVSAFTPPLHGRLEEILRLVPLAVPQIATVLVAISGVGLLLLARGIRRGQRHAWQAALALLGATVIFHLVKGADLEEAIAIVAVMAFLFLNRDAFRTSGDLPSLKGGALALLGGGAITVVLGTVVVEMVTRFEANSQRLPFPVAMRAVGERMIGLSTIALPERLDDFLSPALVGVSVTLAIVAGWLVFRPVVIRRRHQGEDTGQAKAREIVARHGHGTLDYFALRSDKQYWFSESGETLVAYAVYGGVCLVSPDPIGPVSERDAAWGAFRRYADERGWNVAVMGAGEEWLPVYRESGMHDLYVGDEAVVDATRFNLDGGRYKGLRQAVNRVAKYGYTITFHDPSALPPDLEASLRMVMTKSRRGDVERGFSMTLGRVFCPGDHGLLLAVVHDKDTKPVAFCQYVPAPGIDGYSLDLMRRDEGEHPNGLIDFAVVETLRYLREQGKRGLGLNFATMRAVLAGESGHGVTQRAQRWFLRRMSDSMQIESLWRFNAKYDPEWQPRYAVYDAPEHMVPAALAVARAESFWELPLIGRFLVPAGSDPE
jgi:lysylphosphatidylglycerol synthetase-like protein (DUF2156 family)